jgi:hypothetical protein
VVGVVGVVFSDVVGVVGGGGGCGGCAEPFCGTFDLTVVLKFRSKKTDLNNISICTFYLSENYGNSPCIN